VAPLARTARSLALRQLSLVALGLAALGLAACNFDVPSSTYLVETKLLAVLIDVPTLGDLNPDRVGVPSEVPIAEAMPHDMLAFEAYVVDRSGERIPTEELESLWFQCGPFQCDAVVIEGPHALFDRDCAELEDAGLPWDMDTVCRIGGGDGRFEFLVPELGQLMAEQRVAQYYGVIAWEGRTAEDCWAARRSGTESLDKCGFIQRSVKIGPSWWMLVYAETIGLQSPIPLTAIPAGVYLQPANRVPVATFTVTINGELRGSWPEQTQFEVAPGDRISIDGQYDEVSQFLQTYFTASSSDPTGQEFLFQPATELLAEIPFSSNAIVWLEYEPTELMPFPLTWDFVVDELADTGTSRILLVYFDDRFGEGVAAFEFEVQG
jgi:hypothetical protein